VKLKQSLDGASNTENRVGHGKIEENKSVHFLRDKAVLEPHTMLGAGSLVPPGKVLESGYLWVGTPVRRVRPLKDRELEYLDYVAVNYTKLAGEQRGEMAPAS
jgi:carbonic anhydrase/acetyltransferase-like protein (isoleucine patch superfamily)